MSTVESFRELFLRRIEALPERQAQTIPRELLPPDHRAAAVLMLFWPGAGPGVDVIFTKRPEHMPSHPGQVSFPGGKQDPGDASVVATALRETHEELGIDPGRIRVMGRLDDAWSFAGHHVIPIVGWLDSAPEIAPDPAEVAEVLIADVETLLRPESACEHRVEYEGRLRTSHAFRWDGGYVWGLTADLLLELQLWVQGRPSNRAQIRIERMQRLLRERAV
jgi:8-oxo-dGTP pyrophosphatase MutT (NUDIX family)